MVFFQIFWMEVLSERDYFYVDFPHPTDYGLFCGRCPSTDYKSCLDESIMMDFVKSSLLKTSIRIKWYDLVKRSTIDILFGKYSFSLKLPTNLYLRHVAIISGVFYVEISKDYIFFSS